MTGAGANTHKIVLERSIRRKDGSVEEVRIAIVVTNVQKAAIERMEQEGWVLTIKEQKAKIQYVPVFRKKEGGKEKIVHIGEVLYPKSGRVWSNETTFAKDKWDFTPENLRLPTADFVHCKECQSWGRKHPKDRIDASGEIVPTKISQTECARCIFLGKSIETAAKRRKARIEAKISMGVRVEPKALAGEPIELKDFAGVTHCQCTGKELVFEHGSTSLYKASLDRLDSELGYVRGNVRLVCQGVNSLRGELTLEQFEELIMNLNEGQKRDLREWVPSKALEDRIKGLIPKASRAEGTDISYDGVIRLIRETGGVCGITGLAIDLTFSKKAYQPSLDRVDPQAGYFMDNVWVTTWAGNACKGEATVAEVRAFIEELKKKRKRNARTSSKQNNKSKGRESRMP